MCIMKPPSKIVCGHQAMEDSLNSVHQLSTKIKFIMLGQKVKICKCKKYLRLGESRRVRLSRWACTYISLKCRYFLTRIRGPQLGS
jgi:hypothetical protein